MNYYKELPNDYKEYRKIDATDKKFMIIVSIISIFIVIIVFLLCFFIKGIKHIQINNRIDFIYLLLFVLGFVIYTILHELIHGLFYKIFTKEKLKFGLKLSCAYCGIPNIYVKKIQ